jgi:hypothetical protein
MGRFRDTSPSSFSAALVEDTLMGFELFLKSFSKFSNELRARRKRRRSPWTTCEFSHKAMRYLRKIAI